MKENEILCYKQKLELLNCFSSFADLEKIF